MMPEGEDFSSTQAWDSAAEGMIRWMTKYNGPSLDACHKIFERLAEARSFSSATTVLDIGCGSGLGVIALSKSMSSLPPSAQILAIDFSPEMIDHIVGIKRGVLASMGNPEAEIWNKVTAKVMDVSSMNSIETGLVSHAFANFVLFGVEDAENALKEVLRVLESDGVFALTTFRQVGWIDCMRDGIQAVVGRPLPLPILDLQNRWASSESVQAIIKNAGFCDARAEEIHVEMIVDDVETFPSDMMAVPALAMVSSALSETELGRGFDAVKEQLRRHHTDSAGKVRLSATCILGWARK